MRRGPDAAQDSAARRRLPRKAGAALATAALLLPLTAAAPSGSAAPSASAALAGSAAPPGSQAQDSKLQRAFSAAAEEFRVPESVLLGVSYLQSRWDTHAGAPSVAGGYGPMHLTDAATALATSPAPHHSDGGEDARGDSSRPARVPDLGLPEASQLPERLRTLRHAARLTGISAKELRTDAAANLRGGAALLAEAQNRAGGPLSDDPSDWYTAVAAYSGAEDRATAASYADEVFAVIREGAARTTDSGQRVALAPTKGAEPDAARLGSLGLRRAAAGATDCPRTVSCEWIPAPYEEFGEGDYGNHDKANRPADQSIDYIVVHDTEATWETTLRLVQDPTYVSWQYSLRSTDGHIAQHLKLEDVGWHAGNWAVNSKSIGLEHEGFLAAPDAWYTEAMYRSSARLVKYLSERYGIPLDRQHILGHDTVPGPVSANIPRMHTDPGPYWDWQHYFTLLGRPFHLSASPSGGLVTILPEYAEHSPEFTGCTGAGESCPAHGSSAVRLYTAPDEGAPLVRDIGLRPDGSPSTTGVNDVGSRVSTGQRFALAERAGDWTAIWYLGQKAWFHNPKEQPTAVDASGRVITPKAGRAEVPVYGRAYPEAAAYEGTGIAPRPVSPLPYKLLAGQEYAVGDRVRGEYFFSPTFEVEGHRVVRGEDVYYEIQFGHRVAFVRAADVDISRHATDRPGGPGGPGGPGTRAGDADREGGHTAGPRWCTASPLSCPGAQACWKSSAGSGLSRAYRSSVMGRSQAAMVTRTLSLRSNWTQEMRLSESLRRRTISRLSPCITGTSSTATTSISSSFSSASSSWATSKGTCFSPRSRAGEPSGRLPMTMAGPRPPNRS